MKIGFSYSLRDPALDHTDDHAEYESRATVDAIAHVLEERGGVVHLPCGTGIVESIARHRPDCVFNIAEGWGGRDRESFVPAICGALGIPYTGSDAVALGVTMDKALTKRVLRDAGIDTPKFVVYDRIPTNEPPFGFPAFVKPNCDGSSRGVHQDSLVNDMDELQRKIEALLRNHQKPVLVEPYLDGRDFCVGILGDDRRVLRTCEVLLGHVDGIPFFSREYKRGETDRLDMKPGVTPGLLRKMERMSLAAWDVIGCRDYARFDFRTNQVGMPYLLEANALPGLSPISGIFIRQAEASGISFGKVIEAILERVEREARKREN